MFVSRTGSSSRGKFVFNVVTCEKFFTCERSLPLNNWEPIVPFQSSVFRPFFFSFHLVFLYFFLHVSLFFFKSFTCLSLLSFSVSFFFLFYLQTSCVLFFFSHFSPLFLFFLGIFWVFVLHFQSYLCTKVSKEFLDQIISVSVPLFSQFFLLSEPPQHDVSTASVGAQTVLGRYILRISPVKLGETEWTRLTNRLEMRGERVGGSGAEPPCFWHATCPLLMACFDAHPCCWTLKGWSGVFLLPNKTSSVGHLSGVSEQSSACSLEKSILQSWGVKHAALLFTRLSWRSSRPPWFGSSCLKPSSSRLTAWK